jgi:hypothetical protein
MGERFKPAVLKTVDGETRPGVRIPLPPPFLCIVFQIADCRVAIPAFGYLPKTDGQSTREAHSETSAPGTG